MPLKRGRPLSGESNDPGVDRRRILDRLRQQRRRERERTDNAIRAEVSIAQREQGDNIVTLPSIEEEDAAVTLLSLGMRKPPDLDVGEDVTSAQQQRNTEDIDEHVSLYVTDLQHAQGHPHSRRPSMTGFFRQFARPKEPRSDFDDIRQNHASPTSHASPDELHRQSNVSGPSAQRLFSANLHQHLSDADVNDDPYFEAEDERTDFCADPGSEVDGDEREDFVRETSQIESDRHNIAFRASVAGLSLGSEDLLRQEQLDLNHTDDESEVNFAAEVEINEELERAGEDTAEKLYEQLQGGHHGCSEDQHDEALRKHMQEEGNNHCSLKDAFRVRNFPSVLGFDNLLATASLEQQPQPTPAQWKAMFCGVPASGDQQLPMNVCLHKEGTQASEPRVTFDVDSFLGFWSSLAAAKRGFAYQPAAQAQQNIQTDVHLEMDTFIDMSDEGYETLRACRKMLRDVPHFLLGRVCGAHNVTVHVLFPHLQPSNGQDRFKAMTDQQMERWTDQVFHPALWHVLPSHYTQHLPPTYRVAVANSKANQVEGRKIETSSYQAQQAIAYHLQPDYLQEIWQNVLQTVRDTPGLADFREPQLFFTAKGTKLTFQNPSSRPTLLDVIEHFESFWDWVIDMDFVDQDRFYVDIGKEICAPTSLLPGQQRHVEQEAQVYSWKRCCLEEYMRWMYDGQPPSVRAQGQQYYHQNMLYDASSLTSVTPKQSVFRKGGLIYSQFYGSVKEMTDAAKRKPFDNDALEEMALDPQLRKAARSVAGGHRREAQIVELAYRASKRRARASILDSKRRSFGIREEHRVTWGLLQRIKALLEVEDRDRLEIVLTDCPPYAWPIRTNVYLDFLWRSADKFATGFEIVHAQSRATSVSWEQTKMMFAFLRCLRFVMGGHRLEPETAMWASQRRSGEGQQQRRWYGLGFCNTLPRYRYCWLEPRVDWERLCFQPSVTNGMLFGNSVLRGQTMRRGREVTAFFDMALALERGIEWIERNRHNQAVREEVLTWLVHICLKQFRLDVLHAVKAEIREDRRDEALKGERAFCHDYFADIMTDGCYLMSGNRCDFKAPSTLVSYLLDHDDQRLRQHWDHKPFRKLYQRARAKLNREDRELEREFTQRYRRWLSRYHWVLPYPCSNALLQTSKAGGRRMWYSISYDEEGRRWVWGRKNWQDGQPPRWPASVSRNETEWAQWIEERGGTIGAEDEGSD